MKGREELSGAGKEEILLQMLVGFVSLVIRSV